MNANAHGRFNVETLRQGATNLIQGHPQAGGGQLARVALGLRLIFGSVAARAAVPEGLLMGVSLLNGAFEQWER